MGRLDPAREVGARIRVLRKRRGLTIEQLAAAARLDANYVGAIERGEQNPTIRVLGKLGVGMGLDLTTLVDVNEEEQDEAALRRVLVARIAKMNATELRRVVRVLDAVRA